MIVSQACKKGGVGKTLLTLSLSSESSRRGYNTLMIDADPNQAIMCYWRAARERNNLGELPKNITIISRDDNYLHKDIHKLKKGFDNVFIDCPPQDSLITNSAMLAAEFVLIPCLPCDTDASLVYRTWQLAKEASVFNEIMKSSIVVNRKETNTVLGKNLKHDLLENIKDAVVLKTELEKRICYAESMAGAFIHELTKEHKAIAEIGALYTEIENILKESN